MSTLTYREDWPVIPYMVLLILGVITSILDFIFIQDLAFQLPCIAAGVILLVPLLFFRMIPRKNLIDAGFPGILATGRLQIVEDHVLVKSGLYKHVRHPIYIGEILRSFWVQLVLASLYGLVFSIAAIILLLVRIGIEEKMLEKKFGDEYREYKKTTSKLIPYIY